MDPEDIQVPPLDPRLVEFIDLRFPERSPDPEDSEREVWMKAGERRLVRWLIQTLRSQEDEG